MRRTGFEAMFASLFGLTGIFAVVSGVYTWGDGWLLAQTDLGRALIPWGDVLLAAPLSLLTAAGLARGARWGRPLGLVTSGAYLLGSVLVWVSVAWVGPPYPWTLVFPPFAGLLLSVGFFVWCLGQAAEANR
jgi:hypothetical protein